MDTQNREPLTLDIVEAGAMAGLNVQASYRAAAQGLMPLIRVGLRRKKVARKAWLDRLNNGEPVSVAE